MANRPHLTHCGLPGIDRVPFGMHACHFYSDRDQLVAALARSSLLRGLDVVRLWLQEEERALADGHDGLRIAGNTSFLTAGGWSMFMEYEQAVTTHINGWRIVALCSYAMAQCNDQQVSAVIQAHHCAFERPDADWQVVVGSGFVCGTESRLG